MSSGGAFPELLKERLGADDFQDFLTRKKGLARGKQLGNIPAGASRKASVPTSGREAASRQVWWAQVRGILRNPFAGRHRGLEQLHHNNLASLVDKINRQYHYGFDATHRYSPAAPEPEAYAARLWGRLREILEKARPSTSQDPIDREIEAFERMKPQLLREYEGKYVALLEGSVRDADSDRRELVRRVYARFGMVTILIRQVLREEPEPQMLPFPDRG